MLEWLRNLLQGLLLHKVVAAAAEVAATVVAAAVDAETTTETEVQIGIIMVETALVRTNIRSLEQI